jgi:hypothetical protein
VEKSDAVYEFAVSHFHLHLLQFLQGPAEVLPVPPTGFLAFFLGSPPGVSNQAGIRKFPMLPRENKVLVAFEFHVGGTILLQEELGQEGRSLRCSCFRGPSPTLPKRIISANKFLDK